MFALFSFPYAVEPVVIIGSASSGDPAIGCKSPHPAGPSDVRAEAY